MFIPQKCFTKRYKFPHLGRISIGLTHFPARVESLWVALKAKLCFPQSSAWLWKENLSHVKIDSTLRHPQKTVFFLGKTGGGDSCLHKLICYRFLCHGKNNEIA